MDPKTALQNLLSAHEQASEAKAALESWLGGGGFRPQLSVQYYDEVDTKRPAELMGLSENGYVISFSPDEVFSVLPKFNEYLGAHWVDERTNRPCALEI